MEKNIDDLIDQLSLQQLKKLVSKYARLDGQLREDLSGTPPLTDLCWKNGGEGWKKQLSEILRVS